MLIRKCAVCGRDIEVSLPYSKQYVYYKTKRKWYHLDCFTVEATPRMNIPSWIDKTSKFVLDAVSKDDIDRLIKTHYNVAFVPSATYVKLARIFDGSYKGLSQPIPPEDLLEMFQLKQSYLDKISGKKGLTGISKFNYDLAIILGKYDSYLKWKAEKESEGEKSAAPERINYKPSYFSHKQCENQDELDYNSILDDLMD